jgi:hypothetical protein
MGEKGARRISYADDGKAMERWFGNGVLKNERLEEVERMKKCEVEEYI